MNAYITAPIEEKVWTTVRPEFGYDTEKWALIVRALYGLKSTGAVFRAQLGRCMQGLVYEPFLANPDLFTKSDVIPEDKYEYYSYILCYVDDIMVIHHDSLSILKNIYKYFTLKHFPIGEPDIYLGAKLSKITMPNEVWCWSMSPYQYVQEAVRNSETRLKYQCGGKYYLVKYVANPFDYHYEPKVDVSETLDPKMAWY